MKIEKREKEAFAVIGKEGSTSDGKDFIQKLWEEANAHFEEISHLAKKTKTEISSEYGALCPTFPAPLSPGRISEEAFTLRALSAESRRKPPRAGQNGWYPLTSISAPRAKAWIRSGRLSGI